MSTTKVGLALSGGALRGAFSVGAVQGIHKWLEENERSFDAVAGTSTGALIAPHALLGEWHTLREAYGKAVGEDVYRKNSKRSLYFKIFKSLVTGKSIVPDSFGSFDPLRKRISEYLTEKDWSRLVELSEEGRSLYLTTVNLTTKELTYWSLKEPVVDDRTLIEKAAIRTIRNREELIEVMVASATIPLSAPPVKLSDGHEHVDGGVREQLPAWICVAHGVERLFIIGTSPKQTVEQERLRQYPPAELQWDFDSFATDFNTMAFNLYTMGASGMEIIKSSLSAITDEALDDEVRYLYLYANFNRLAGEAGLEPKLGNFPLNDIIYIAPEEKLDAPDLHAIETDKMRKMIDLGLKAAERELRA